MKSEVQSRAAKAANEIQPGDRVTIAELAPPPDEEPLTECERDTIMVRVAADRIVLVDLGPLEGRCPTNAQIAVEVLTRLGWTRPQIGLLLLGPRGAG